MRSKLTEVERRIASFVFGQAQARMDRLKCPFCGNVVLFNDARTMTYHQGTSCMRWNKLVESMGAKRI